MTQEELKYYIISDSARVLDALRILNTFGSDRAQTLFVVDSRGSLAGSITDGDIRRRLVEGLQLESPVESVANRHVHSLSTDNMSISLISEFKAKDIELIPILDPEGRIVDAINLKKQKSYVPVDAVIMAGGKGQRLLPLTATTPKPLLPLGGKAIIDHIVGSLLEYGIDSISVTVNYLKEQLIDHFSRPFDGVRINCVEEPGFLGTIGSLRFAMPLLKHDTVLLTNSDAITDLNYESFYLHFREHDADMSVAAVPYSFSVPYGIFDLDGRNIRGVLEKPTYNYYANAGIYLIRRELLDLIPEGEFFNATDFMDKLIAMGKRVIRFPLTGYWLDIGVHDEYARAKEYIKHINK